MLKDLRNTMVVDIDILDDVRKHVSELSKGFEPKERLAVMKHLKMTEHYSDILASGMPSENITAIRAAALMHDISKFVVRSEHNHAAESAELAAQFLMRFIDKPDITSDFVNKVNYLITRHETGGTHQADVLMNADCISFLETGVQRFFEKQPALTAIAATQERIDLVYAKINDKRAKELAHPFYKKAQAWLHKVQLSGVAKKTVTKKTAARKAGVKAATKKAAKKKKK